MNTTIVKIAGIQERGALATDATRSTLIAPKTAT